jgi:hypothetical protein
MERGEPPGSPERGDRQVERSEASTAKKPMRINVDISFVEAETGIGARHILLNPLRDALYDASVLREDDEGGKPFNRTLAAVQGVTAQRVNGHVRYKGILSVSSDVADMVHANVRAAIEGLQDKFKRGFESVQVDLADPPSPSPADKVPSVESAHGDFAGHGEQRESDRDGVGAGAARA